MATDYILEDLHNCLARPRPVFTVQLAESFPVIHKTNTAVSALVVHVQWQLFVTIVIFTTSLGL